MRAVILSAGLGTRMWPITHYFPKALLNVGKKTIFERQIEALYANRVYDIDVVVGHFSWMFEKRYPGFRYIFNKRYTEVNTIHSLKLALEQDASTTLIINGDTVFDAEHIKALMKAGNYAMVEYGISNEEAVKIKIGNCFPEILEIGKNADVKSSCGEAVGLYRIESRFAEILLYYMKTMPDDLYYEDAMNLVLRKQPMKSIGALNVVEVDTQEDMDRAEKLYG